ncbi:MAG TPA: DUF2167 domain-containing protein [Candidatus Acidoferrum sp.]|nr:DUF2167 domain-containing protein [Candidatus Acidoferrum sp.]
MSVYSIFPIVKGNAMRYKSILAWASITFFFAVVLGLVCDCSLADDPPSKPDKDKIDWVDGPVVARLGDIAEIKIPEGYRFTGKEGTRKVLELTQNPASGSELGTIVPILGEEDHESWFVIFEFNEVGYVKDDDRDKLDADALLKSIKDNTEEANKERASRGWPPYHVSSWYKPPYYDSVSKNLTWAAQGYSTDKNQQQEFSVNYSVRILGRRGTMNADLVLSPAIADKTRPSFERLLTGFSFLPGGRYAEFRPGDKVSEYGLATLVTGGAIAVAAKTGLLAKLWKLIVVALAALAAAVKRGWAALKQKLSGKSEDESAQLE